MSKRDPKKVRYAPGTDPVPPEQQIPEWPSDSAEWMNVPYPLYPEPLFPDGATQDQEATDG